MERGALELVTPSCVRHFFTPPFCGFVRLRQEMPLVSGERWKPLVQLDVYGGFLVEQSAAAPAQRRRGRPQRLPFEATSSSHAPFDVDCRLAWLLATSRLLSPSTTELPREAFLEQVRAQGISIDASRISRWESGQLPATHKLVEAYENVIGLPDGALWATSRLLHRSSGEDARSASVRPAEARTSEELDDLFDRIEARTATGGHWLRMTSDLAHFERVYLHRTTWTTLCTQLVGELTRSSGIAFFRRYEAACALLAHPQGRPAPHPEPGPLRPAPRRAERRPRHHAAARGVRPGGGRAGAAADVGPEQDAPPRRERRGRPRWSPAAGSPRARSTMLEAHTGMELGKRGAITRRTDAIDLATQLPEESYDRVLAAIPEPRVRHRVEQRPGDPRAGAPRPGPGGLRGRGDVRRGGHPAGGVRPRPDAAPTGAREPVPRPARAPAPGVGAARGEPVRRARGPGHPRPGRRQPTTWWPA